MQYVADCWSKCFVGKYILIPKFKLKIEKHGVTSTIYLKTIAHFCNVALEVINSVH